MSRRLLSALRGKHLARCLFVFSGVAVALITAAVAWGYFSSTGHAGTTFTTATLDAPVITSLDAGRGTGFPRLVDRRRSDRFGRKRHLLRDARRRCSDRMPGRRRPDVRHELHGHRTCGGQPHIHRHRGLAHLDRDELDRQRDRRIGRRDQARLHDAAGGGCSGRYDVADFAGRQGRGCSGQRRHDRHGHCHARDLERPRGGFPLVREQRVPDGDGGRGRGVVHELSDHGRGRGGHVHAGCDAHRTHLDRRFEQRRHHHRFCEQARVHDAAASARHRRHELLQVTGREGRGLERQRAHR